MNNALIIGGSKGLGHSLAINLSNMNYNNIYILDKNPPDTNIPNSKYYQFDVIKDDYNILTKFYNINTLIITIGIGRLASFETFHDIEIQKTLQINTISVIRIIKFFYNKLKYDKIFFCSLVSSISGIVSSPLFSIYAASKSALYRFSESINIELEKEKSNNRILNICPGYLEGTSFYNKNSDYKKLDYTSKEILNSIFNRNTIYIPDYEDIYKDIINNYCKDNYKFGLESYDYKINSNRINTKQSCKIGYLSGTFDLFHIGHLNIIRKAKEYCDYLIVGVHKDAAHKGKKVFIPFKERCDIIKNIKYVDYVIVSKAEDCDVYEDYKFDFLFVGSDYKGSERFRRYEDFFKDKNVKIIYLPYTKKTSSTKLRNILDKFA